MIIGEERAVGELWERGARAACPSRARTGRASPSTRSPSRREPGETRPAAGDDRRPRAAAPGLRRRARGGARRRPARARRRGLPLAHARADRRRAARGSGSRTASILFKAEASAWTPAAVQIQQVWVDPEARGQRLRSRGLRDLCRLLLESTPIVTLFVRTENAPAIAPLRVDRHAAASAATARSSSVQRGDPRPARRERVQRRAASLNGDVAVAVRADAGRASSRRGRSARRCADEPLDLCVTSEFERAQADRRRGARAAATCRGSSCRS